MAERLVSGLSGATWFTGDPHFGHEKVAALRGFDSTEEHDTAIVNKWTKQVNDSDVVYVLGDLSSGSRTGERYALNIIAALPGRKRLIAGNHDSISGIHRKVSPHTPLFQQVFEAIHDFGRVRIDGKDVLLSHYPYTGDHTEEPRFDQFRLKDKGAPLIHAHTHSQVRRQGSSICVSWEAWGRLVNLGDIQQLWKEN